MNNALAIRSLLVLALSASAGAQTVDQFLARLDRSAATFTGAKADMKRASYTASIKVTDTENGSIQVRKAGDKLESKVDIIGENASSYVFRGQTVEHYLPALNMVEIWDMRKYKDLVQTLLVLGFGTSGKELSANYTVSNLRKETIDGHAATAVDLSPKSADIVEKLHLKTAQMWIADSDTAPVRLKLLFTDGNTWTVDYSNVQM